MPTTKDGSYQAANRWWLRKKAELDAIAYPPQPIQPGTPEVIHRILEAWAGRPVTTPEEEKAVIADLIANYDQVEDKVSLQKAILGPERVAQIQAQARSILDTPASPPGRSVTAQVEGWRTAQQARVAAGQLSPDRADANRNALAHFVAFVGHLADVGTIDATKLQGFYLYCLDRVAERRKDKKAGWSLAFAKDVFAVAKSFVRWLWETGRIELPRNLGSKAFKFGNGQKAITTWTPKEFAHVVSEAPGKLKLQLLLMANCGMTQGDVSDLQDKEVDWEEGRIIRQRSKTAGHEQVPTVNYLLWPSIFDLLQKYRSGSSTVLLTESRLPYVRKELVSGRLVKADTIASNWVHLKRRLDFHRPLKQLRKLGATLLEGHPTYGRLVGHFLGHSPRSVAQKHYASPSQELFDEAVTWLGQQLGQV
jgi:integrase